MSSITIRKIDRQTMEGLRVQAARHGRTVEDEASAILSTALAASMPEPDNLAESIRRRFGPFGGVELDIPPRGPMREPPDFGE